MSTTGIGVHVFEGASAPTCAEWIAASLSEAGACPCEIHLPDVSYEERLEIDRLLARRDRERLESASKITSGTKE